MNRRQKIIVSVTGIFLVLLILMGLTYAYFLTRINGNPNNTSISVTTANLDITYSDGNGVLKPYGVVIPGDDIKFYTTDISGNQTTTIVESKTFTVTNTGNQKSSYAVTLEDLLVTYANDATYNGITVKKGDITNLENPSDFEIILECTVTGNGTCKGVTTSLSNKTNEILLLNEIEVNAIHNYTFKMRYKETDEDQSNDMNKSFTAKINIIDSNNTIDIEGNVTNYVLGDYVQTNSTKRISNISNTGLYKIVGLEVGTHILKICSKSDTNCINPKMTQTLNIVKGTSPSVDKTTNTITITEDSRNSNINIDANTKKITIDETINDYDSNAGILAVNYTKGRNINITTTETIEDSEINTKAISYPFSITNVSNEHRNITIKLTNIKMDESLKSTEFRWGLFNANTGNALSRGIFKYTEKEELLYTNSIIDSGEDTRNYILRIWLHNNGLNQNDLLNKNFSAKIEINGEAVEYSDESCFKFSNGAITGYDAKTCGPEAIIPKTINNETVVAINSIEWTYYENYKSKVIIPNTVTTLGNGVFNYNSELYSTYSITVPEGVTEIGSHSFSENSADYIFLPDTITKIGSYSFEYTDIKYFIFPKKTTEIGTSLFAQSYIENIIYMDGTTNPYIQDLYYGMPVETMVISGTITNVYGYGGGYFTIKNLIVQEGVEEIDSFFDMGIVNVDLPNTLKRIGNEAFSGNPIKTIVIPSSVEYIGFYAFRGCNELEEIIIYGKSSLDEFEYSEDSTNEEFPSGVKFTFVP